MSEKNKNTWREPDEFLRYRRKKMTGREMNYFEKHLLKDPFAEEAAEGFENIDPDQAERDLLKLQKQIGRKTAGHRIAWYSIAASVAILMIVVSVLMVLNKKGPVEIAYTPPVQNKVEEKKTAAGEVMVQPVNEAPSRVSGSTPEKAEQEVVQQKKVVEIQVSDEVISTENAMDESKPVEGVKMAEEPAPVFLKEKATLLRNAIAIEAAIDTSREIRNDSDVISLDEIVVVGYGTAKKKDTENEYIHTPPEPVDGRAEFNRYIRDNIRRPDTTTSGQRVVVVLDFIVRNNGIIDSIKVIRSPGTNFSDEAIRLLKEGPAWKPAMENGNPVNDKVRLRIAFK